MMDVKQAISAAKDHVLDIFKDEGVLNVGLEEVSFDEKANAWDVTVGFSRSWDNLSSALAAALATTPNYRRTYRVVTISNATEKVLSVKIRSSEFAT